MRPYATPITAAQVWDAAESLYEEGQKRGHLP